jgi:beta-glucosidase
MTIEEKAMQLSSVLPVGLFGADGPLQSELDAQLKNGIGHVAALGLIGHKTPEQMAKLVNAVQRGVVALHFTRFPTSIGLAATWDPAATQEMADIIRRQMRAASCSHPSPSPTRARGAGPKSCSSTPPTLPPA